MTLVLIADDNEQGRYLLRALLEGHGYRVESVRHGQDALDKARTERPDLIVSDLLMPVMDGYALLRAWRRDPVLRDVPFVVYTATYTEQDDEKLAVDLGADVFLRKPADLDQLVERVEGVLRRSGSTPPRVAAPTVEGEPLLERYNAALVRKLEKKLTELEAANRQLREERAELALRDRVLKAVSQAIVIVDGNAPDLPIVYVSPSFERMTGYPAAEVLGKNCRFLQGPDTDKDTVREVREALQQQRPCEVEILNYRRDGTPFWNALAIAPSFDEEGKLTHFVGVQSDITERRSLEQQLRHAQKMEAVGQLAAGVAHDFNNLLTVILSYATVILDAQGPGELRDDVHEILRAGERAAELTRQLLAFSRHQLVQRRLLSLDDVVRGLEKLMRRAVGEHIELVVAATSAPATIQGDSGQLEQVILNLVMNSRDALPEGGRVTIETSLVTLDDEYAATRHDVRPGPYVMLAVSDNGVGMDAKTRERIFEPFFTTKTDGRGIGLGLAMVFGIVKQSHGHLAVYSERGHGTTMRIYLPVAGEAVQQGVESAPAPSRLEGSETVLVVEDEAAVRAIIASVLRRHGYQVLEAPDGANALERAERYAGPIHLLVTDVVMPAMSGAELAARIATSRPDMRVVFMSGYTHSAAVHQRVLAGEARFLQKPITPTRLLEMVRRTLDDGGEPPTSGDGG